LILVKGECVITIPEGVFTKYFAYLNKTGVPTSSCSEYKKWLRYYLDFCDKYPVPESTSERVRLFTNKLLDKKQSLAQRQRAANAVSLYFQMEKQENSERKENTSILCCDEPTKYDGVKQSRLSGEPTVVHQPLQTLPPTAMQGIQAL
jgi:hypothetical protein